MNTKIISQKNKTFFAFNKEKDHKLAKFIFPSICFERKNRGLELKMIRFTILFWDYRYHFNFGKVTPAPTDPITSEIFKVGEFLNWVNHWAGRDIRRKEFDSWLNQSDWKSLVRWGGTSYHYSKILLAREFLTDIDAEEEDNINEEEELNLTMVDLNSFNNPSINNKDKYEEINLSFNDENNKNDNDFIIDRQKELEEKAKRIERYSDPNYKKKPVLGRKRRMELERLEQERLEREQKNIE